MNSVLHYFISSDVPRAVSYYDSNFAPLRRTIRLSGYPHPVLEEVLSAVCRHAQEENTPLHCIHHCLDHSLCGVILPDRSAGVYGFDVYDEAEPNFLAVTRSEELSLLRANLKQPENYLPRPEAFMTSRRKFISGVWTLQPQIVSRKIRSACFSAECRVKKMARRCTGFSARRP